MWGPLAATTKVIAAAPLGRTKTMTIEAFVLTPRLKQKYLLKLSPKGEGFIPIVGQ